MISFEYNYLGEKVLMDQLSCLGFMHVFDLCVSYPWYSKYVCLLINF